MSVRTQIVSIAVVVTAIALAVAAGFVLVGLGGSLRAEIDDSVIDQAWDFAVNVGDVASFESTTQFINDEETLQMVFDSEGQVYLSNDEGLDVGEVMAEIPFADSLESDDVLLVDASFESASSTIGSDKIRAVVEPVFLVDEQPGFAQLYVLVGRTTVGIDDAVAETRNRLLLAFAALIAVVGLLAWWLAGRALRPVEVLRREVDDITAGDLGQRVTEPAGRDEVAELAVTMNTMLERLESSSVREQQFVSDAAHELRTPLASIAAQLDVDVAHPDVADHAGTATNVRREVSRMRQLIDNLLRLARADAAGPSLNDAGRRAPLLDLDEIIRTSPGRIAVPRHVSIDSSKVMPAEVRGDPGSLTSVVDNLVANAVRHAASAVALSSGVDGEGPWCLVDDDGHGIAPQDRERVFHRFVRLDEARDRDQGGSGLGLALARELTHEFGGTISVTDSPLGGARFKVRLGAA